MREGRLVSNLLVVSVVVIQQECRQKSRGSFSFLSRCVLCFQFYPPCVGRFQFIPQWADKIEKCEWFIITETTLLFSIYARPTELFQMRPNWKGRVSGIISISSARECCRPTYYFNFFRAIRNKMKVPESTVFLLCSSLIKKASVKLVLLYCHHSFMFKAYCFTWHMHISTIWYISITGGS